MKTIKGSAAKIDSVFVGEAEINTMERDGIILKATYGLMNTDTGDRFGSGNRNGWSKQTYDKLQDLLDSMEEDIAISVFGEEAVRATSGGGEVVDLPTSDGVPGL